MLQKTWIIFTVLTDIKHIQEGNIVWEDNIKIQSGILIRLILDYFLQGSIIMNNSNSSNKDKRSNQIVCQNMNWVIQPRMDEKRKCLLGGLAISNILFCESETQMMENSITAVISVCGDSLKMPVKVQHFWIVIGDSPYENIKCFFRSSFDFIEENISKGNVLVHCRAGISRSSSIVISYLIKKQSMTFEKAFELVRSSRPIAQPNKGFIKQLKEFSRQIRKQLEAQNEQKAKKRVNACLLF